MKEKIKVIVAEDNVILQEQICQAINDSGFAQVIATASNGKEAVDLLRSMPTDVLMLDLIMPFIDGIGVLEIIDRENIFVNEIIVLSAIGHEDIIKRVMSLKAHYYIIKPFEMEMVLERIRTFSIINKEQSKIYSFNGRRGKDNRNLDDKISSIFLSIGIPAHIKGYQFLKVAVKNVMETPSMINAITKELYPSVAVEFDTTASKVERAIRHAIEVAWSRGRIENINKIFGYNIYTKNDKPTNGEFIALIADKLTIDRSA